CTPTGPAGPRRRCRGRRARESAVRTAAAPRPPRRSAAPYAARLLPAVASMEPSHLSCALAASPGNFVGATRPTGRHERKKPAHPVSLDFLVQTTSRTLASFELFE